MLSGIVTIVTLSTTAVLGEPAASAYLAKVPGRTGQADEELAGFNGPIVGLIEMVNEFRGGSIWRSHPLSLPLRHVFRYS